MLEDNGCLIRGLNEIFKKRLNPGYFLRKAIYHDKEMLCKRCQQYFEAMQ